MTPEKALRGSPGGLAGLPASLRIRTPPPGAGSSGSGGEIVGPPAPSPARTFALSAVVPGAGQYALGIDRWVPYLALEIWGWIRYLGARSEAESLQDDYRDLAWFVARRVSVGPRRDGDFEYYEALTRYRASGAFDADPGRRGLQPEADEGTFNGSTWALARAIFFPSGDEEPGPGTTPYERALDYYRERAVDARFAWDWGPNAPEQDVFANQIRKSDEAFREATILLGVIVGNHFISAVDALVTAKLRESGSPVRSARLRAFALPSAPGGAWGLELRLTH